MYRECVDINRLLYLYFLIPAPDGQTKTSQILHWSEVAAAFFAVASYFANRQIGKVSIASLQNCVSAAMDTLQRLLNALNDRRQDSPNSHAQKFQAFTMSGGSCFYFQNNQATYPI
jgi:hypothetical protein